MKIFLSFVVEWKSAAALVFSAAVFLSGGIMFLNGMDSMSINMLASLLAVSMVSTFLKLLAFGDYVIKNVRHTARMIIFAIPFFTLLAAAALFFQWFDLDDTTLWAWLLGIFLVVFIAWIVSFEIYFRVMGKKYDGLLEQYRKQRDLEGKN